MLNNMNVAVHASGVGARMGRVWPTKRWDCDRARAQSAQPKSVVQRGSCSYVVFVGSHCGSCLLDVSIDGHAGHLSWFPRGPSHVKL